MGGWVDGWMGMGCGGVWGHARMQCVVCRVGTKRSYESASSTKEAASTSSTATLPTAERSCGCIQSTGNCLIERAALGKRACSNERMPFSLLESKRRTALAKRLGPEVDRRLPCLASYLSAVQNDPCLWNFQHDALAMATARRREEMEDLCRWWMNR